jgi:hypothetical protein
MTTGQPPFGKDLSSMNPRFCGTTAHRKSAGSIPERTDAKAF